MPHVETALHEFLGQRVQQRLVRGRIGDSQIVERINETSPEKVAPHPIDEGPGEVRIVRRGHPVDEVMPRVVKCRNVERMLTKAVRRDDVSSERVLHVASWLHEDRLVRSPLRDTGSTFAIDSTKERRQAVVVFLADLLEGMMMAAGTANPHAEEHLSCVVHIAVQVTHLGIPLGRRVHADVPRRRDHAADKLVVRHVFRNCVPNPAVKRNRAGDAR